MRIRPIQRAGAGIALIECLVYFGLFALVAGLAFGVYVRCLDGSRRLQRSAADVVLALNAGERWREDVRRASGFQLSGNSLVLTQASGCVEYSYSDSVLWRRDGTNSTRFLARVKNSIMQPEAYQRVSALRWELQLETTRTNLAMKPLFTFKAALSQNR